MAGNMDDIYFIESSITRETPKIVLFKPGSNKNNNST